MRVLFFSVLLLSLALAGCKGSGGDSGGGVSQPTITGMSPNQLNPGTENIEGRITGANLSGVTGVDLGEGVVVEQFSGLSASEIYIFFSVLRDAAPGPRKISVITTAGVAQSSSAFTVGDNRLPLAKFTVTPPIGYKATTFKFDGSGSVDFDGNIVNYQWHFGDGSNRNGKVVNYQFQRAGSFAVRLTVVDNRGATNTAERLMDVDPSKPPVARMSVSPSTGNVSTVFRFDGSASSDPDGKVTVYSWSFGDGNLAKGMVVEHKYGSENSYSPSLSVSDNTGQSSRVTGSVRVNKDPEPPPPPGDDDDGGGGGGSCDANNFNTNYFTVVAVSGNTITADQSFRECPGLCGEVRRPGGAGIREFVGDITGINGANISINTGSLPASTRPEVGERLNIVWRGCGG